MVDEAMSWHRAYIIAELMAGDVATEASREQRAAASRQSALAASRRDKLVQHLMDGTRPAGFYEATDDDD